MLMTDIINDNISMWCH